MATLIVIDMQDKFLDGLYRDLAKRIIDLIHFAKENGDDIILVEYGSRWYPEAPVQRTILAIRNSVRDYDKLHRVVKVDDDGSDIISEYMEEHNLSSTIIACGVNTSCCVKDTVMGLVDNCNKNVTVVAECCENVFHSDETPYTEFTQHETLKVVETPADAYQLVTA